MEIAQVWMVALLFLWATGEVATAGLRLRVSDRLVLLGLQFGLGLSIWPIVFLATSSIGIVMPSQAMRVLVFATIIVGCLTFIVRARRVRLSRVREALPLLITFAILAIIAIVTRVSHIEGLAFPPWVDGVHHAMIVRLILERGVVPATADPYIAGADFFYHWGFHAPAAFVAAATGAAKNSDLPQFLLQYGQALNALALVMTYAAGRVLLRSRFAGLLTASLAMFVSYYPGFYLSWGRYTHLTGVLVLPPLLIALWQLAFASRPLRWMIASSILASGLLLIHVRIALFAFAFALVMLVATRPLIARTLLRWSASGLFAALLASPWLLLLARNPHVGDVTAPIVNRGASMHLIASTHNRELLAIATGGVSGIAGWLAMPIVGRALSAAWWVLIVLASRKKTSVRRTPWAALQMIAAWLAILAIALYWKPFGLDLTGFASLDSAIITLFLPLTLIAAALIVWVFAQLVPRLRGVWMYALVIGGSIAGAATTMHIVNPATVFTEPSDLRAMHWIEANVPRTALFAVDSRAWIPPARVGVDGGYWLHVTTGRRSILPPLLYAWSLPRPRIDATNQLLASWSSTNPDWRALRAAGVTHIYIGARGSEEKRRALLMTNRVKLVHRDGNVLVFAIR